MINVSQYQTKQRQENIKLCRKEKQMHHSMQNPLCTVYFGPVVQRNALGIHDPLSDHSGQWSHESLSRVDSIDHWSENRFIWEACDGWEILMRILPKERTLFFIFVLLCFHWAPSSTCRGGTGGLGYVPPENLDIWKMSKFGTLKSNFQHSGSILCFVFSCNQNGYTTCKFTIYMYMYKAQPFL